VLLNPSNADGSKIRRPPLHQRERHRSGTTRGDNDDKKYHQHDHSFFIEAAHSRYAVRLAT